jgi:glycosyltransferase involved in cell wall biosynthesis
MQLLKNTTLFQITKKSFLKMVHRSNSFTFGRMFFPLLGVSILAGYAVLMGFYYRQWKRLNNYFPSISPSVTVSVVIAARNEEQTLPHLIRDLQKQDYPSHLFEVLIIDDFSTDGTALLRQALPSNFRMLTPEGNAQQSTKKKAIAAGVAAAGGELILVTDADCRVGKQWISTIASFYVETGASFIAAPVKYTVQPSLLQVLQALDFITLQGITAASVNADFGAMCNGANLGIHQRSLQACRWFCGHRESAHWRRHAADAQDPAASTGKGVLPQKQRSHRKHLANDNLERLL